jgi:hypothetical protein
VEGLSFQFPEMNGLRAAALSERMLVLVAGPMFVAVLVVLVLVGVKADTDEREVTRKVTAESFMLFLYSFVFYL